MTWQSRRDIVEVRISSMKIFAVSYHWNFLEGTIKTFHIFLHKGFLLFIHWLSKLKSFFFNFKVVYVCMNVSVALIPSCTWVGRICCYLLYLLFWLHGRLYSISMFLQVYKTQFYSCLWCTGVAQTSTYELMTLAMTAKHYIHSHKFCNKRKLRTYFLTMQPTWKFH